MLFGIKKIQFHLGVFDLDLAIDMDEMPPVRDGNELGWGRIMPTHKPICNKKNYPYPSGTHLKHKHTCEFFKARGYS